MHLNELILDQNRQELTKFGTPAFPVAFMITNLSDYLEKRSPWHWHRQVELNLITEGCCELNLEHRVQLMEKGDVAVINASSLHSQRQKSNEPCRLIVIIFDPMLVYGEPNSLIEKKFVLPFTENADLDAYAFTPRESWQETMSLCIRDAFQANQERAFAYELKVRDRLSECWYQLITNMKDELIAVNTHSEKDERLKTMLGYIQENYMNAITLADIASSGNISTRECSRYFKEQIHISPVNYLINYRIRISCGMLTETKLSITEICYAVGFNGTSYFTQIFRKATGITPKEYRLQNRTSMQSK